MYITFGLANEANKTVSQTVDECLQTDKDMLKEIVKEEISAYMKAYKLHQEYTSSPNSDEWIWLWLWRWILKLKTVSDQSESSWM